MDLFMTFIIESKKFRRMTGSKAQICWKRHSYLSSTKPEKVPLMASSKQNSDLAEICVLCLQFCWRMCLSGSCWGKQWLIFDTILQYISRFNASSVRVTSAGLDSNHFRLFILLWIMFWLQHIKSSLVDSPCTHLQTFKIQTRTATQYCQTLFYCLSLRLKPFSNEGPLITL